MKKLNRIKGALYGVAIGDAFGAPLEFMSAEQIYQKHGRVTEMLGGGWLDVEPGEITDDTQMTLAVAQGIVDWPDDPVPAIGEYFIQWLKSYPKDVGGTCRSSILYAINANVKTKKEWHGVSSLIAIQNKGKSGGNGALMRAIYPALYYNERNIAVKIAIDIAQMTHFDDESNMACEAYTRLIHRIVHGDTVAKSEFCDSKNELAKNPHCSKKPTGYVIDSFYWVFFALANTDSFEDAIILAANAGGDADTIAAITGGIAGAFYGYDAIPERWINALDANIKKDLDKLAKVAYENVIHDNILITKKCDNLNNNDNLNKFQFKEVL